MQNANHSILSAIASNRQIYQNPQAFSDALFEHIGVAPSEPQLSFDLTFSCERMLIELHDDIGPHDQELLETLFSTNTFLLNLSSLSATTRTLSLSAWTLPDQQSAVWIHLPKLNLATQIRAVLEAQGQEHLVESKFWKLGALGTNVSQGVALEEALMHQGSSEINGQGARVAVLAPGILSKWLSSLTHRFAHEAHNEGRMQWKSGIECPYGPVEIAQSAMAFERHTDFKIQSLLERLNMLSSQSSFLGTNAQIVSLEEKIFQAPGDPRRAAPLTLQSQMNKFSPRLPATVRR